MSARQYLTNFLLYLEKEKQLATLTVTHYERDLNRFIAHLEDNDPHTVSTVTPKIVRHFVSSLRHKGLSARSIARMLSAIRQFYHYLIRENISTHNPALSVQPPKGKQSLPNPPDVDKTQAMFNIKIDSELEVRDIAMIEITYACGLRLSELVPLRLSSFNRDEHLLRVIGKGQKTRLVPIGTRAIDALDTWLDIRAHYARPEAEDIIFISKQGKPLTPRAIQKRFARFGQYYTDFHLHPHLLRHAFASHMLESSGNLRAVQTLLGHADIVSTQVYTHLDFQHLADVYDQAHPRAKRKPEPK